MSAGAADEAVRCLSLVSLALARPGATPAELSKLARVPVKQVFRDLFGTAMLCGVPPYLPHQFVTCRLEGGRVTVSFAEQFARPVSLTPLEATALAAALEAVDGAARGSVEALLAKLEATMPEGVRRRWRKLRDAWRTAERDPATDDRRAVLREAVRMRRKATFRYRSLGRSDATRRVVAPLGLFTRRGVWYLAGVEDGRSGVRSYRPDRMTDVAMNDDAFERPASFRLTEFAARSGEFDEGAGEALVLVAAADVRRLKESGASGRWRKKGADYEWRPRFADADAFAEFLLGTGADFEVIAPETLRACVAATAKRALKAHARPPGGRASGG